MQVKTINRLFYLLDAILVILAIYFIYVGKFSEIIFIRAIILLLLFSIYRWLCEWLGLPASRTNLFKFKKLEEFIDKILLRKKEINKLGKYAKFSNFIRKFVLLDIFSKGNNYFIFDLVFIIFYYNPFNWHWLFAQWLHTKLFYFFVWLNGNLNIFLKRYFNFNFSKYNSFFINLDITKKGYRKKNIKKMEKFLLYFFLFLKGIFIYPFLRMLMFIPFIKEKILMRYWLEFFKIRFIALMYSIVLTTSGFYDYYNNLDWYWWLLFIYVYFAIIWPSFSYLTYRRFNKLANLDIIHPSLFHILLKNEDRIITHKFLSIFVREVNFFCDNYLLKNYGINKLSCLVNINFYSMYYAHYCMFKFNFYDQSLLKFKVFEKVNSIPILLYYFEMSLFWLLFFDFELYNIDAKVLYGVKEWENLIKKYRERMHDLARCMCFVFMDCRRYLGVDINEGEFVYFIGDDLIMKDLPIVERMGKFLHYYMKNLDFNYLQMEFLSLNNYKTFVEINKFIKNYKDDFVFPIMRTTIEDNSIDMGVYFSSVNETQANEIILDLAKIGRNAEKDYKDLYEKMVLNKESKNKSDFIFISLIEIEKFEKKWKGKYLKPFYVYEEDEIEDGYWWKRKNI